MIRFVVEGATDVALLDTMLAKPRYADINNVKGIGVVHAGGYGLIQVRMQKVADGLVKILRADQTVAIIVVCDGDGVENRAADLNNKIDDVKAKLKEEHGDIASNIEFYPFIAEREVEAWMLAEGESVRAAKLKKLKLSNERILANYVATQEASDGTKFYFQNILRFPKDNYDSGWAKRIGEEMTFDPAINTSPSFRTFYAGLEQIIARIKVANPL